MTNKARICLSSSATHPPSPWFRLWSSSIESRSWPYKTKPDQMHYSQPVDHATSIHAPAEALMKSIYGRFVVWPTNHDARDRRQWHCRMKWYRRRGLELKNTNQPITSRWRRRTTTTRDRILIGLYVTIRLRETRFFVARPKLRPDRQSAAAAVGCDSMRGDQTEATTVAACVTSHPIPEWGRVNQPASHRDNRMKAKLLIIHKWATRHRILNELKCILILLWWIISVPPEMNYLFWFKFMRLFAIRCRRSLSTSRDNIRDN